MVTKSSAQAEFQVMAHGICELLWLKILLNELGYDYKDPMRFFFYKSMRLYYDNNVVMLIIQFSMIKLNSMKLIRHFIKKKLRT
jgi:hypothetical protein